MPFTLAHPAATLPLWYASRQRLNLLALMVGSVVPDLGYFLALEPTDTFRHTVLGAMTQDVGEGLLLFAIVRYGLAQPLLHLLPTVIAQRCLDVAIVSPLTVRHAITLSLSILLGALSHLVWDSFTHSTGWMVQQSPILQLPIGHWPIYKWLQYGSGLVGVGGLLLWARRSLKQGGPDRAVTTLPWRVKTLLYGGISLVALGFIALAVGLHSSPLDTRATVGVRAVIGAISGGFVGLVLYAVGFSITMNDSR
jgi:Domain of unknown function (DUF4184)